MTVEYKMLRDIRKEITNLQISNDTTIKNFKTMNENFEKAHDRFRNIDQRLSSIEDHISKTPKKKFKLTN